MTPTSRTARPLQLIGVAALAIVLASSGCSWLRNKTHYQDSKEANPLEVPPDLDAPNTSAATAMPAVSSTSLPTSVAGAGRLPVSAADAYPKIGEILATIPGVVVDGRAEALNSYDVTYKGESFLLRVLDATGGSRLVALSPDGRMLITGSPAELISAVKAKF